jgi:hypothetical protein
VFEPLEFGDVVRAVVGITDWDRETHPGILTVEETKPQVVVRPSNHLEFCVCDDEHLCSV